MEIGENQLPFPYQVIFRLDGLLYLHYHFRLGVDILDVGQNLGAHILVFLVAEATVLASRMLHVDRVAMFCQLGNARGSHANAVLVVLHLFWYSYPHSARIL